MQLTSDNRNYFKVKAAYLYYKEGKTQAEIADLFHMSRLTIIKLLNEAREEEIITFNINYSKVGEYFVEQEEILCNKLQLKDVQIVRAMSEKQEAINSSIGSTAARYLTGLLESGMTVGVGWGNTLQTMINYIRPNSKIHNLTFIPTLGGFSNTQNDSYSMFVNTLCESIATNFNDSVVEMLYSPLIVRNVEVAKAIVKTEYINIFNRMNHLDIAIVGIDGDLEHSTTIRLESTLQNIYDELVQKAFVGNVCSHFYTINGDLTPLSIEDRIISIPAAALHQTPYVIGAGGGEYKVPSIIGASRAKLFNILITDEFTALKLVASLT